MPNDNFSAINLKLGQVFGLFENSDEKKFIIPDLQRDYSWGDEQFQEFWEDINSEYNTFFGDILVKDSNDTFNDVEVIDGQQRLTTVTIFTSVIVNMMQSLSRIPGLSHEVKTSIKSRSEEIKKSFIDRYTINFQTDPPSRNHNYYLNLQSNVNSKFEEFIQSNEDVDHSWLEITSRDRIHQPFFNKNMPVRRMQECYNFFYKKIKESPKFLNQNWQDKVQFFDDLIKKLNSLQIVYIQSESDDLAYEYFEAVNARGVDLTVSDLLKNLILKHIRDENKSLEAKNLWLDTIKTIQDFDDSNNAVADFFRYYWSSTNGYIPKKQLYKEIKNVKERDLNNEDEWLDFCKELNHYANLYKTLLDPRKTKEDFEEFFHNSQVLKIFDSVYGLRSTNTKLWTVLFMTLLNENNLEYFKTRANFPFKKFFEIIEKFTFAYSFVCKDKSNQIWTLYCSFSKMLRKFKNDDTAERYVNDHLKKESSDDHFGFYHKIKEYMPSEEQFKKDALLNLKYTGKGRFAIRYYLREIEKHIYNNHEFSRDDVTCEHIVPQNPKQHWGFTAKECKEIHSIGNLILMERTVNSRLSNKSFNDKCDIMKNPSNGSNLNQVKNGIFDSEGNPLFDFNTISSTNKDAINERSDKVINDMKLIWIDRIISLCN